MADEDTTLTEDSVQDPTSDVDWQKRYTDTQSEFTKKSQALKDAESVWEDEQALLARIQDKFPHLIAEEEEETVEPDDSSEYEPEPEYMTKAEYDKREEEKQAAQAARDAQAQFEQDYKKFIGDRELDQYGDAALRAGSYKGPEELEQAITAYFEHMDSLGGSKRKRKTTASPQGGQAATGVPNYEDMTSDQINQAMVERARALDTQI